MVGSSELAKKIEETREIAATGDVPDGVSPYFVQMALSALRKGAKLEEVKDSFLEFQDERAEKVERTFSWLAKVLGM